ncbi:MAG: epoxyqueuosine reductase QueH [Bacilli bacterium]|nr:epoxyqueuosine reductase QueH [Bacilli bacterium]
MIDSYEKYLKLLKSLDGKKPTLLLQACCAPCSSAVLEQLTPYFDITILYYNPNTYPEIEFEKRYLEFEKLDGFQMMKVNYNHEEFLAVSKGLEDVAEGGARCYKCYELRLQKTATLANEIGFDYFSTTLSISPHKNSKWINEIGLSLDKENGSRFLYSDFKKKEGYKRSIQISKDMGLYRQDYCGCEYSLRDKNTH